MAVESGTVQVVMPAMGDSVAEGTVLEWHKGVGDQVQPDETIVEISTDKVDAEVPAPVAGTIAMATAPARAASITILGTVTGGGATFTNFDGPVISTTAGTGTNIFRPGARGAHVGGAGGGGGIHFGGAGIAVPGGGHARFGSGAELALS